MAIKTYQYRLYPNKSQAERLDFLLWQGRKIYNGALAMRKEHYEQTGETISLYDLRDYWCAQRKIEPDTLGQLPYATIDDLIRRLDKAYKAFFRRVKSGEEEAGFPRFKDRWHFNSLGFNPVNQPVRPTSEGWAKLKITSLDELRLRYHRPLPDGARVKMIVIKRDKLGNWWANLQIEYDLTAPEAHDGPAIGIDIGLVYALALSDGTTFERPKWYVEAQQKRRVIMRKLDRQRRANNPQNFNADGTVKPGVFIWHKSTRMKETERQLRKLEAKIQQQRNYWWNGITDRLTKTYSLIAIEDLTLDFMIQNRRLAMGVYDASFFTFWQQLAYKCAERGVELVKVPPAYTSQTCPECGVVSAENRQTQARFECVSCGHTDNADVNAARNILNAALRRAVPALRGKSEAIGSELPCEDRTEIALAAR